MMRARPFVHAGLAALAALASAAPSWAEPQAVNPIHPTFAPLDEAGRPAARPQDVSADRTCGACHDAQAIADHDAHARAGVRVSCLQCHVEGARLPTDRLEGGKLRREDLRIGRPRAASCGACHGLVGDDPDPVAVPADFEAPPEARTFSLTQGEGAVVSPQRMRDSFLNLAGKEERVVPWDVHAARLVDCVACHHAGNDPRRTDLKQPLRHVTADPRRPSVAEFLLRPDHRLARAGCRSCHEGRTVHGFLPYRERHLQVLSCVACHAPGPMGPALQAVDATAVTAAGTPVFTYRNVERAPGGEREPLNAAVVHPLRTLLVLRTEADGVRRLAPVNVVSRWRWVAGPDRAEVPFEQVVRAWREGEGWAPAVLSTLDADGDGALSAAERRLDTPARAEVIAARLRALGVDAPAIDGVLHPHPLAHGIVGREGALRDCGACHGPGSRLEGTYTLADYLPGAVPPRPPEDGRVELAGDVSLSPAGELRLVRDPGRLAGLHLVGSTRRRHADGVGLAVFALVLLGVTVHGAARGILGGRARASGRPAPASLRDEYAFGRYERLWHWTMAVTGLGLIGNGLLLRLGGSDLAGRAAVHNALAMVFVANAGLALFYHLATAAIRTFLPAPRGLAGRVLAHLRYQTRGIFLGHPDPAHAEAHKLNPVQQLTYLALLNVLFPLQIATGGLLWAAGHWPGVADGLGGLAVIAPLHDLGAWLFLSFVTLHVYLVTTGRTPGEHLRAMVTGYRKVTTPDRGQGA